MTVKEVFANAAKYIRTNGWTQGRFGDVGEPVCLLGALRAGAGRNPSYPFPDPIEDEEDQKIANVYLEASALAYLKCPGNDLVNWNDSCLRTEAEVLTFLDELAAT